MASDKKKNSSSDRRNFVGKCATGTFVGAVGLAAVGSLCGLKPSVLPDPSEQFKIGSAQDFPVGSVKVFDKENVAVFSNSDGLYAISLVCTHLGCIVSLNNKDGRFDCPCHGSKFTFEGKVVKAPAPKPLPWFKITAQPGGELMVDKGMKVARGTKVVA